MRWLVLTHRYAGIGIGLMMAAWCLSGFVLMYVHYPQVTGQERRSHLPALELTHCCKIVADSLPDDARVTEFEVEMLADVPVLRVRLEPAQTRLIDLRSGAVMGGVPAPLAAHVADAFVRAGGSNAGTARLMQVMDFDQWTVSGEFAAERPLLKFGFFDRSGSESAGRTHVYVSSVSGRVVQATAARVRFWNWLGAIPHWLYFTGLRQHVQAWSRVVIGLSLAGCLLAVSGIVLGSREFLRQPTGRWSSYRGVLSWHHGAGLLFGTFALSWVASGLLSVNPWGVLEGRDHGGVARALSGEPMSGARVKSIVPLLSSAVAPAVSSSGAIVSVQSAPLLNRLYMIVTTADGARVRLDEQAFPARLSDSDWEAIAGALHAAQRQPERLPDGDDYFHRRAGNDVRLPVERLTGGDEQRTRYYFDPLSADLLGAADPGIRGYRWLFQGIHTLDFTARMRARPLWDLVMIVLLAGTTVVCALGAWLGMRRLTRA